MFRIKVPTKRIFRIFPILRTDGMSPFCNLFIERPSYIGLLLLQVSMLNNNVKILLVPFVRHIELQNFLNAPRIYTLHSWCWGQLSLPSLRGSKWVGLAITMRWSIATKNTSESLPETLRAEGHSAAGWGTWICNSCRQRVPKSVDLGNELPLLGLHHLVSFPVSKPLRTVNRCCSGPDL